MKSDEFLAAPYNDESKTERHPDQVLPHQCESVGRVVELGRKFQKPQHEGCEHRPYMFMRLGSRQRLRALCPYHFQRAVEYSIKKGTFSSSRTLTLEEGFEEWTIQKVMLS